MSTESRHANLAFVGLTLWGAGVQCNEALATAGLATTTAAGLWRVWQGRAKVSWSNYLWLGCFVGSALFFPLIGARWPTGSGLARILDWVALPFAVVALSSLGAQQRSMLGAIAFGVLTVSGLVAGFQHFGVWPGVDFFEPLNFTKIGFSRVYEPVPGSDETRFMAGGLLFHRLKFANVSSLVLLAGLNGILNRTPFRAIGLAALIAGALAVVVFPATRVAAVALIMSCAIQMWFRLRNRTRWVSLAVLVLIFVVGVAAAPGLRARFRQSMEGEETGERTVLLKAGLTAFGGSPLTGVGLGRFRAANFLATDAPVAARAHAGKTHNQWLTLAVEGGFFTGFAYLTLLLGLFAQALKERNSLLASVLVFVAAVSLFHDPLFHAETSMAMVLALALALSPAPPPTRDTRP